MLPEQLGLAPPVIAMETLLEAVGLIVTDMELEVAEAGLAQAELEVIIQLIISPVESVLLVYVSLFVPASFPFTFH